MHRRVVALLLALAAAGAAGCGHRASTPVQVKGAPSGDWLRFGVDAARSNVFRGPTGITAANVGSLVRRRIELPGTVDSSPLYVHDARITGGRHDAFVVTTTYGRTLAVDADSGRTLWTFTPAGYAGWAGSAQITNATPLVDPGRRFVYSVSPDGRVHKLLLVSGRELRSASWPVVVTRDPTHEKVAPALNLSRGLLLVATGGYLGDAPPYQGHVVAIDAGSGAVVNVFDTLCSDRSGLLVPSSCPSSDSAIWGRAGVVVEPGSGRLLVATGNGPWNGTTDWGDSVLELSPNAGRLLQAYTPSNQAELESGDVDLGSTAPALLGRGLALQGGKDGLLRLLDLGRLNGSGGARPVTGGELQLVQAPGRVQVFTTPAVWRRGATTLVFVATSAGTAAYRLERGGSPRLVQAWENGRGGTSPVLAGGLLYVYDPEGGLNVYRPESGALLATLQSGPGHWNSPIVVDGRIALPEGDANDHAQKGILDVYGSPASEST